MTDRTCATCRWWEGRASDVSEWYPELVGWGGCALFDAELGGPHSNLVRVHPEAKAMGIDGEDYRAGLVTAPGFGCVQHEPIP